MQQDLLVRVIAAMTKANALFILLFLIGCARAEDVSVCEVISNPDAFSGRKVRLDVEAAFVENTALVSNSSCQNICTYWNLSEKVTERSLGHKLWNEVKKQRAKYSVGVSADLTIEGYLRRRDGMSSSLEVTKIVDFKMRSFEDRPKIVCGNDLEKEVPIGDCSVDAAGCSEKGD